MILDRKELNQRYAQRLMGVRDKKVYIGPERVVLFINNTCNLSCRYCWTHAPGNPRHFDDPKRLSLEKFVEIIDDAVDLKVDQIYLSGSGEPTMHPSFRNMMRYSETILHRAVMIKKKQRKCIKLRSESHLIDLLAIKNDNFF